jgi:hypothetical protein
VHVAIVDIFEALPAMVLPAVVLLAAVINAAENTVTVPLAALLAIIATTASSVAINNEN